MAPDPGRARASHAKANEPLPGAPNLTPTPPNIETCVFGSSHRAAETLQDGEQVHEQTQVSRLLQKDTQVCAVFMVQLQWAAVGPAVLLERGEQQFCRLLSLWIWTVASSSLALLLPHSQRMLSVCPAAT